MASDGGRVNEELKDSNLKEEINILILGETGVGKSTWINGIVNYKTFSSLDDARKENPPLSLIGSSFTITNEKFDSIEIKIGEDKNEVNDPGTSATQCPKAYLFETEDKLIRLIDTPGIGDTRGIEQDKENFDMILKYLANLDKLNGICILLKPNNARLTTMFEFCIKGLLTNLHKDASRNIVFCFTNARGSFYKPGDTLPPLKKLLQENPNVEIQLNQDTVYCMDNEPFRFLCALHHGIKFDDNDMKNFSASWDKSVAETNRMFDRIATLEPHRLVDTISLNEARKTIVTLTKPMAEISRNIQRNLEVVEDKKIEIEECKSSLAELQQKREIPAIVLVSKQLGYPRTVCTSSQCVRYHTIPGTNLTTTDHITHCHPQCYLSSVVVERYPNPELQRCSAMNESLNCKKCGCGWDKHMHITYEHEETTKNVIDETTKKLIESKQSVKEAKEVMIQQLNRRVSILEGEQQFITEASAKFGRFLKTNAIAPYNDAMADYLEMLIRQERERVDAGGDGKTLDRMRDMQRAYKEEIKILEQSMNSKGDDSNVIRREDVRELVEKLCQLPINGSTMRNTFEVAKAGNSQMVACNEVHYHVKKVTRFQNVRSAAGRMFGTLVENFSYFYRGQSK